MGKVMQDTFNLDEPFAVIADIHGNALALRAVLAHIDAQGISAIVNLGDHFSGPLDAAGVWDLLSERPMLSVRGNHDRYLIDTPADDLGASDRAAHDVLADDALDWIATLPSEIDLGAVYLCHATPTDDNLYWTEAVVNGGIQLADSAEIERHAADISAGLILYAHTHVPRIVHVSGQQMLVNPGSVGCPAYSDVAPMPHVVQVGSPLASYCVIRRSASRWQVSHHAVPYDWDAAAHQARSQGREDWAKAIATGWL